MQVVLPRSWKEQFAAAAAKREEIAHWEKLARYDERMRQRRNDQIEDERQDAEMISAVEFVLASAEEVAEFRVQLDEYDAKTVEALMENSEALDAARKHVNALLDNAFVLPDGRRVFKTKDGMRVFDEHGAEVASDVVDADAIGNNRPDWETYDAAVKDQVRLEEEQDKLLAYQAKLDDARERLDQGQITENELDSIKADLAADMPDAVREKLGIEKQEANADPAREVASVQPALPADMDSLMRQTGVGAGPAGP